MDIYFKYKYHELFNPVLQALEQLGGSATISEIENKVAEILDLSEEAINEIHRESTTKLTYRLAWARSYLKQYGVLDNSQRGVWSLTEKGKKTKSIDPEEVKRLVKLKRRAVNIHEKQRGLTNNDWEPEEEISWQESLLETVGKITPAQFEKLCLRLLRELGFVDLKITGKPNDGGIDGRGFIRLGGVLSFQVVFQAKRYQGTVSTSVVRDFRGAMSGRAEKGVLITTGSFSNEAKKEARRDGAIQIDLIDGNDLAEKLKELNMGVKTEFVEEVNIDEDWFRQI